MTIVTHETPIEQAAPAPRWRPNPIDLDPDLEVIQEGFRQESSAALTRVATASPYCDLEYHLAGYRSQGGDGKPLYALEPAGTRENYLRRTRMAEAEARLAEAYGLGAAEERVQKAARTELACREAGCWEDHSCQS